jgi:hypothetical protein
MSVKWSPLPSLWPPPATSAAVGDFELFVFTQDGVPTWEVHYNVRKLPDRGFDPLASGTADSFDAAKAAALYEASVLISGKSGT